MYVADLGFDVKWVEYGFKDLDTKQGIVSGYFSAFGNKDSDGDIIVKGAYAKTIQENGPKSARPRIKHQLDHNRFNTVAVIQELSEDNIGLAYVSKAGSHNNGQDWFKMCVDGIITEHSVGIEQIKGDKKSDANYMLELKLWEGSSLQSWGSNFMTPVTETKALEYSRLMQKFHAIEKGLRDGTYTDATFIKLEAELNNIKNLLIKLNDTTEPGAKSESTQPAAIDGGVFDTLKQFTNSLKVV